MAFCLLIDYVGLPVYKRINTWVILVILIVYDAILTIII